MSGYLELVRPGWIIPGVSGAAMLVSSAAVYMAHGPDWRVLAALALSAGCFAAPGGSRLATGAGAVLLAAGLACMGRSRMSLVLGILFALLTGWLVNAAALARRNKAV